MTLFPECGNIVHVHGLMVKLRIIAFKSKFPLCGNFIKEQVRRIIPHYREVFSRDGFQVRCVSAHGSPDSRYQIYVR